MNKFIEKIISSREKLVNNLNLSYKKVAAEGGCGVLGVISSIPIKGKFLLPPLIQMHNRGNGKGGGIAAVGISPKQLGVSRKILEEDYLIQVAYLDSKVRKKVEREFINPYLEVDFSERISTIKDHKNISLEVKPPDVWRYFARVNEDILEKFIEENKFEGLNSEKVEDEFIYRNSFALNKKYYSSLEDKKAFVVSHGKNMLVLKIVGYAEQVIQYYKLENLEAKIWVGHQRYPTKGKVWHPAGSHPFIGLNDALVHNGDFANYHSITEYLKQRNMYPLFLTDTEVAALYWDLLTRVYQYPLEYAIEAIAPTTERDFTMLPEEKKRIYKAIQETHIHGSPDGPWFFIIARNVPEKKKFQLIGITDTSMLRPQVFALQEGKEKIGLIASEKQAIDAMLKSLSKENPPERFYPMADLYWYARGGSYTDGGAFIFTLDNSDGINRVNNLTCTDKFGKVISTKRNQKEEEEEYQRRRIRNYDPGHFSELEKFKKFKKLSRGLNSTELFNWVAKNIKEWDIEEIYLFVEKLRKYAKKVEKGDKEISVIIKTLTLLIDRRYNIVGEKKRNILFSILEEKLFEIFYSLPSIESNLKSNYSLINWEKRKKLRKPLSQNQTLVVDVYDFEPEGDNGVCKFIEKAYKLGWRKFIAYNFRGQRNFGAGLVTKKDEKVKIDIYGRVGDCLAAFADGPEFYVHESAQDSIGYCFKSGKLVIYGDAGKAFEYGAKGGKAFILGDLIDRPLINSVGSATAVINGSCKDYMGESCMAAHGLTILNGIKFSEKSGRIVEQETPYHGGNLFPLAAASVVYLRDPKKTIHEDQLNGGKILPLSKKDWEKILPLLKENEKLFGIKVKDLLNFEGKIRRPEEVYRKVIPIEVAALTKYESGI
jgi:glutamate synthase domain-containing protein 1/glutamate synthase domain-containing protein 3